MDVMYADAIFKQLERLDDESDCYLAALEEEKARDLNEELDRLDTLSEEEACREYVADSKEEARRLIVEYWEFN